MSQRDGFCYPGIHCECALMHAIKRLYVEISGFLSPLMMKTTSEYTCFSLTLVVYFLPTCSSLQ